LNEKKIDFHVRQAEIGDIPFISDTWLMSYRRSKTMRSLGPQEYFVRQRPVMESIMGRSFMVVGQEPRSGELLGYVVFEKSQAGTIIHWLYTKLIFRNFGIGRELLERAVGNDRPIWYTHKPTAVYGAKLAKLINAQYNPKFLGG